jgi:WD40 repeat protein
VILWDARTFERRATFALPSPPNTAAINDDATLVAAGDSDGGVTVFDVATGRDILHYAHTAAVESVAFGPLGLVSTSFDRHVIIWDIAGTADAVVTPSVTTHRPPDKGAP